MALVVRLGRNQGIRIGEDVWVYVQRDRHVGHDRIKLVISAPEGVKVLREELLALQGEPVGPLYHPEHYLPLVHLPKGKR